MRSFLLSILILFSLGSCSLNKKVKWDFSDAQFYKALQLIIDSTELQKKKVKFHIHNKTFIDVTTATYNYGALNNSYYRYIIDTSSIYFGTKTKSLLDSMFNDVRKGLKHHLIIDSIKLNRPGISIGDFEKNKIKYGYIYYFSPLMFHITQNNIYTMWGTMAIVNEGLYNYSNYINAKLDLTKGKERIIYLDWAPYDRYSAPPNNYDYIQQKCFYDDNCIK